jgi:hypothetical protein
MNQIYTFERKKFPIFWLTKVAKFVTKKSLSARKYGRSFEIVIESCFSHFVSFGSIIVACSPWIIDVFS